MKIIAIPAGPIGTNAWLLLNEAKKEAILFDAPPLSYNPVKKELEKGQYQLKALFITHGHWDHMLDTVLFAKDGVPVYANEDSREFLENPEKMCDFAIPGLVFKGTSITHFVNDGDILNICDFDLEVRTAPGHCPGSIIIYIKNLETVVTGDVIFDGSIGRTDFPGGSFELLKSQILAKVYTLPEKAILCPGHGGVSTIGKEKKSNPFVRVEV